MQKSLGCKMALKKCCCCVDLRSGALVIAILGTVLAVAGVTFAVLDMAMVFGDDDIGVPVHIPVLIYFGFELLASICLLVGAVKRENISTMIYLVLEMICIALDIIYCIFIIDIALNGHGEVDASATSVIICAILVAVTNVALSIYFWICILSFWKELKGTPRHKQPL